MGMITKLGKARQLRIAGFALAGVAVAGAAVAVTASAAGFTLGFKPNGSSQPAAASSAALSQSSTSSTVCSDFMSHLAVRMGKSQAQINTAFQQAIADTLADQVKNKQITQAQADQIAKKLAGQTPCTLAQTMPAKGHAKPAGIGAYMQAYESAAAGALGITPDQLKADLAAGQSLSQIAATQHVSEADFRTKLIANLQPTLDAAVANKTLTATQEQAIINQLKTGELPLWNRPAHPKPGATATPTPTPVGA